MTARSTELTVQVAAAESERDRVAALLALVEWLASTDPRAARPRAKEALDAAERIGDPAIMARARRAYARSLLFTRGPREAYEELCHARVAAEALGDPREIAWCDHFLGVALEFLGDPGGATVHLEAALLRFRRVGEQAGEAYVRTALGEQQRVMGNLGEALQLHKQAAGLARSAGDEVSQHISLINCAEVQGLLGVFAAKRSRAANAKELFEASLADFRRAHELIQQHHDPSREPVALAGQVLPLCWLGRINEAVDIANAALAAAGEVDLDHRLATALQAAGMAYVVRGELAKAIGFLHRALALYEQWHLTYDTAAVLRLLVEAYERRGDVSDALATHKQLLAAELKLRETIGEREDQVAVARMEAERTAPQSGELVTVDSGEQRLLQLVRMQRRLTDERRAMERLAHTDALTGLANRRHFEAQMTRSLVQTELRNAPFTLIMVDIDHFKRINDCHSHLVGDAVLKKVARELARHCRASDLACRIGGEEFGILLPATDLRLGRIVAERLRHFVQDMDVSQLSPDLVTTISVGVATAVRADAQALVLAADKALYAAKSGGRNRVCWSEEVIGADAVVALPPRHALTSAPLP